MMARTSAPTRVDLRALVAALLPFLGAQLVVLGLTIAFPGLARLAMPTSPVAAAQHKLSPQQVERLLQQSLPPPDRGQ